MPMNLGQIDANLLPILDAVLQECSVTRAAARLGRTQPAVSQAMGRLRNLLQDEILVRTGQRYELTAKAQAIKAPLNAILQQLSDALVVEPVFDPATADFEFGIVTTDYLAASIVGPAMGKLAETAPGVRLSIIDAGGADGFSMIRSGVGQIVISPRDEPPRAPDLHYETLIHDTWCGAVWSGNTSVGDSLSIEAFQTLPQIIELFSPSPEGDFLGRILTEKRIGRRYMVRTNYILLMPLLLKGTPALSVLPRRLAEWLRPVAELRILPLPFDLPDYTLEMCWSARYTGDPAHSWLRGLLKEAALDMGAS